MKGLRFSFNTVKTQFTTLLIITISAIIVLIYGFSEDSNRFKRFLTMNAGILRCLDIMNDIEETARKIMFEHQSLPKEQIDKLFVDYHTELTKVVDTIEEAYQFTEQPYSATSNSLHEINGALDMLNELIQKNDDDENAIVTKLLEFSDYLSSLPDSNEVKLLQKNIETQAIVSFLRYSKLAISGTQSKYARDTTGMYNDAIRLISKHRNFTASNLNEVDIQKIRTTLDDVLIMIKEHNELVLKIKHPAKVQLVKKIDFSLMRNFSEA